MADDDDTETNAELRAELTQARERVQREIEILISPSSIGGGPANAQVLADLKKELGEIESALAGLN